MLRRIFLILEEYFEPVCIVILIASMTLLIFVQIILRVFDASLPQAEEVARYLFVWAMYLSISYAIRDERHIRILFLIEKLPTFGRNLALNCADIIFLLYSLAVFYYGFHVVNQSLELGQIAPATELPVAVLYASVVVSSALGVVRLVLRMYKRAIALNESATLRAIEK